MSENRGLDNSILVSNLASALPERMPVALYFQASNETPCLVDENLKVTNQ